MLYHSTVKLKNKIFYIFFNKCEIVNKIYKNAFESLSFRGITIFNDKPIPIIYINNTLPTNEIYLTYIHELMHLYDYLIDFKLFTSNDLIKIEYSIDKIIKYYFIPNKNLFIDNTFDKHLLNNVINEYYIHINPTCLLEYLLNLKLNNKFLFNTICNYSLEFPY